MIANLLGGIASLFQPGTKNHLTPQAPPTAPRYNPSQGPASIEYLTGQQQKPFNYETPGTPAATSFLDLANQAGRAAQQAAKPAGNFWYNNQQVDEATYRRLTAPAAPASIASQAPGQAAATSNMDLTGIQGVLNAVKDSTQENRARFNQVWDQFNAAKNPYDVNGQAFQGALNSATNRANRSMSGAEARAQGALAGRGMLGSGYESATLGALAAQRGALVSDTQGRMYDDAYRGGAQWEQDKLRGVASLVAGDYSGTLGALDNLAKLPGYLESQQIDNTGGGIRNEAAKAQLRSYALEAQMSEETFAAELAAKKQQYEAAKQQGREAAWMSENSWWMGPLKAVLNVGVGVAKAVATGGMA